MLCFTDHTFPGLVFESVRPKTARKPSVKCSSLWTTLRLPRSPPPEIPLSLRFTFRFLSFVSRVTLTMRNFNCCSPPGFGRATRGMFHNLFFLLEWVMGEMHWSGISSPDHVAAAALFSLRWGEPSLQEPSPHPRGWGVLDSGGGQGDSKEWYSGKTSKCRASPGCLRSQLCLCLSFVTWGKCLV